MTKLLKQVVFPYDIQAIHRLLYLHHPPLFIMSKEFVLLKSTFSPYLLSYTRQVRTLRHIYILRMFFFNLL